MAFVVKVEGAEAFEVSKECVKSVKMTTDIPLDSNARTKDVGATMVIKGKIPTAVGGDPFDTNAFVVDYKEDYGDEEGTGTFTLMIKQKKDKISTVTVEGGYSA